MLIDKPDAHYPLIIIGSGPAGMTIAHELVTLRGFERVLMIESGAMDYDPAINELSLVNASGDLSDAYYATHSIRAFGGTSLVWGGWCAVMEPMSFNLGEWPFEHESLMPYYERARLILELPPDATKKVSTPVRPGSALNYRPFYMSEPVRFGEKYRDFAETSEALHVLLETTVRQILHENGKATGVDIGGESTVTADKIVLACGGIGNPRLLLLSGLTANDQVGRCFMEHLHVETDQVVIQGDTLTSTQQVSGVRMNAFAIDETLLAENGMRSFTMSTGPKEDAGLAPNVGPNAARAYMTLQLEMLPDEDNRVTLDEDLDALGQKKTHVSFEFNANESFPALWRFAGEKILRENLGRFSSPVAITQPTGGGHLMGTTRMGPPGKGCVNEHGELHGCQSLFVAGSSVFPASGSVNPTFTIVALALKLADHLVEISA